MIDAHCHIDLYPHPTEIAEKAFRAKVLTVAVTNLPSAFEKAYPHVKAFSNLRLALGLHPLLAAQHASERQRFHQLVDKTSYIGEVGLDFSTEGYKSKETQIESFKFVLKTLENKRKFVSIHSRRAEAQILDILDQTNYKFPVVFHWYSGSLSLLDKALQKGHYFSINPAMIESTNGQKIINRIPLERVLSETDGPFVMIAGKAVDPTDVSKVERYLASKRLVSNQEAKDIIKENFMKIVRPIGVVKL